MTSSVRARAPHWNKSARRLAGAAVGPLIVALNDAEGRVQGSAASALGKDRRPHAVEPIVAALKDKNFLLLDVVDSALRPPAVEPLVAALVEPLIAALGDGDVREYVESALAKIKDPRAVEPLFSVLKDDAVVLRGVDRVGKRIVVPSFAAAALETIGAPAVEPLIAALKDVDGNVREYAAATWGQIRDARAVEPLIAALQEASSGFRSVAASALAQIGTPAVEPLTAALKNANVNVRQVAASALGMIRTREPPKPCWPP